LATLTGLTTYQDIENVQANFTLFVANSPSQYSTWIEAWENFVSTGGVL